VGRGVALWAGSIVHTFIAIRRCERSSRAATTPRIDLQGATAEQEALAVVTP